MGIDGDTGGSVLLGCFEPPSFGGASTSGYQLFRLLRERLPAHYLNLVPRADLPALSQALGESVCNPENLAGVRTFALDKPTFHHQPGLRECIGGTSPRVLVAIGYVAGYVLGQARPDLPMVLLVSGCQQVKDAIADGALDSVEALLGGEAPARIYNDIEHRALSRSTLVITHSDLVARVLALYFPDLRPRLLERVLWFYDWIHASAARRRHVARRFGERDIDILFVASDWARVEKNLAFVEEIAASFPGRSVHVAGRTPRVVPGAVHHGLVPNDEAVGLMGRAKVLVCPSRFDAAPGVLFEGAAMGCNLVASPNCGNHRICHRALRVSPFTARGFVERVSLALERPFPANTGEFEGAGNLAHLCDILERYLTSAPQTAPAAV